MPQIQPKELPQHALSAPYQEQQAYLDCLTTEVAGQVSLADYIEAFYTTPLFKLERRLLALARKPASDADARALAQAETERFSAWTVEGRHPDQLLLRDFTGRTRSWLMVESTGPQTTRLYFGSVVVPLAYNEAGEPRFGPLFGLLQSFHDRYSRGLLKAAAKAIGKRGPGTNR